MTRRTRSTGALVAGLVAAPLLAAALLGPGVAAAAPVRTPPVPNVSVQYWFGNYQISKIWALGATGRGITVAVLDSGVQANRVEFTGGVVLRGTDFAGGDGRTDTDTPTGHGTSIARLIAGQGGGKQNLTGIAPGAKILPVTVLPKYSRALDPARADSMGIDYAVAHGAKVINLSVAADAAGEPGNCPTAVATAVRNAIVHGAVVVAGAGNKGTEGNPAEWPAACPGVVAVGAIDGAKKPWPQSERQPYVDVAAPGVGMADTTLTGVVGTSDGTSNSTALVSGAIALVWSKYPHLTNRQVVARLLATVTDDATTPGRDNATGYGVVRPYNAIVDKVAANAPNPIFDEIKPVASSAPSSSPAPTPTSSSSVAAPSAATDSGSSTGPVVIAVVALLVVLGVVLAVVLSRRRSSVPSGPPPPGYPPPGYPPPGYPER